MNAWAVHGTVAVAGSCGRIVAEKRHRRHRRVAQSDAGKCGMCYFYIFIPRDEPGVMVRRRRWQYDPLVHGLACIRLAYQSCTRAVQEPVLELVRAG